MLVSDSKQLAFGNHHHHYPLLMRSSFTCADARQGNFEIIRTSNHRDSAWSEHAQHGWVRLHVFCNHVSKGLRILNLFEPRHVLQDCFGSLRNIGAATSELIKKLTPCSEQSGVYSFNALSKESKAITKVLGFVTSALALERFFAAKPNSE